MILMTRTVIKRRQCCFITQQNAEKLKFILRNFIYYFQIHVYSVHDTTYTLDRTIQDILFDVFYLGLIIVLVYVLKELFTSFIKMEIHGHILHCIQEENIHFTDMKFSILTYTFCIYTPKSTYFNLKRSVHTHFV